jgi:hypothetical protein
MITKKDQMLAGEMAMQRKAIAPAANATGRIGRL